MPQIAVVYQDKNIIFRAFIFISIWYLNYWIILSSDESKLLVNAASIAVHVQGGIKCCGTVVVFIKVVSFVVAFVVVLVVGLVVLVDFDVEYFVVIAAGVEDGPKLSFNGVIRLPLKREFIQD